MLIKRGCMGLGVVGRVCGGLDGCEWWGGGSNFNVNTFENESEPEIRNLKKFAIFYSKRAHTSSETEVYTQKKENRPTCFDFDFFGVNPPTCLKY